MLNLRISQFLFDSICGVVYTAHKSDLTESYFGKLARGQFPRLSFGQIRQIGRIIFSNSRPTTFFRRAILGWMPGRKVNMNTESLLQFVMYILSRI